MFEASTLYLEVQEVSRLYMEVPKVNLEVYEESGGYLGVQVSNKKCLEFHVVK